MVATLPKNSYSAKKDATLTLKYPKHLIIRISMGLGSSKNSVSVSASFEEKETRVLALALTLALFLPSFATSFAKASEIEEGFGGRSTPNGQKLQLVE